MSKSYIHLFQTVEDYNDERKDNYNEPWLSYTMENSQISFNKTEREKYLSMKIISGGTISFYISPGTF